jgi:hypothetical protein
MSETTTLETEFEREEWRRIERRRQVAFATSATTSNGDPSQTADPTPTDGDALTGKESGARAAAMPGAKSDGNHGRSTAQDGVQRPENLVGLALSGGGLRSALFNDGFLQALSHKGLLRYVDYLCSVSGGGYIAGHLMTYTRPRGASASESSKTPHPTKGAGQTGEVQLAEQNFHDREVSQLGRQADTGEETLHHLPAIGSYLNRTSEFFAGYCLHQLPVFVLYISLVGTLATMLAIWYRSFDEPIFRMVFESGLGVNFGGELLIAFLPALFVGICVFLLASFGWIFAAFGVDRVYGIRSIAQVTRGGAKLLFWPLVLLCMASVAVFLGNSLTSTSANSNQSNWYLNQFSAYIAVIAGAIQILVFIGRDRLFQSEKSEAAHWKKVAQSLIANGVVAFLIFAMIHAMARENISTYTFTRDPFLVSGEVSDWPLLAGLFDEFAAEHQQPPVDTNPSDGQAIKPQQSGQASQRTAASGSSPAGASPTDAGPNAGTPSDQDPAGETFVDTLDYVDFNRWAERNVLGGSLARKHWKYALATDSVVRLGIRTRDETSRPPSPLEQAAATNKLPISNLWRIKAMAASCLVGGFFSSEAESEVQVPEMDEPSVSGLWAAAAVFQANQMKYIQANNPLLETQEFTDFLLGRMVAHGNEATAGAKTEKSSLAGLLDNKEIERRLAQFPLSRRKTLEDSLNRHDLNSLATADLTSRLEDRQAWTNPLNTPAARPSSETTAERVRLNRDLLELSSNGLLKAYHIASTPVVQIHDQNARWRWLTIWLSLLFLSLVGTSNLNRIGFLFDFYHDAIARSFLRSRDAEHVSGQSNVAQLQPEEFGLPYPIYLAAWLKLDTRFGNRRSPRAVAISPNRIELRDGEDIHIERAERYEFQDGQRVRLADAVAVSGAAVTPLMTNTFALSILMDFLGARLGIWFRRPGSSPVREHSVGAYLWTAAALFAVLVLLVGRLGGPWLFVLVTGLNIAAIVVCLCFQRGYPQMCLSLLSQLIDVKRYGKPDRNKNELELADRRISRCWPNIFVADGGFYDFLGVTELLRRQCDMIIVSDAGVNTGSTTLESLATMCENASSDLGVRFVDLDHDTPIDFGRLARDENRNAPQPYLAMRMKYPTGKEGLLFYAQMAITESDPIEIQQIRNRFPSFPDEPTTNQFYTDEQVAAYRNLGYHIGSRLCSHLQTWTAADIAADCLKFPQCAEFDTWRRQPLFQEVQRRLMRSYVQLCYEEFYYRDNDVYGESIWREETTGRYPAFAKAVGKLRQEVERSGSANTVGDQHVSRFWLDQFSENADVFSRYLEAVNYDVNPLDAASTHSRCAELFADLVPERTSEAPLPSNSELWTAHLAVVAAACQQLHRGVPSATLQVGGRKKLCSLVAHIANDLVQRDIKRLNHLSVARALVHEIYELRESVFQSADDVAVVSFVQCICKEIAQWKEPDWTPPDWVQAGATEDSDDPSLPPTSSRMFDLNLDFRQLLLDKIQSGYRSRVQELIAWYLKALVEKVEPAIFQEASEVTLTRSLTEAQHGAPDTARPR